MSTHRSTVKWFDAKKGYGFIDHPEGGDDVFVHYTQIESEKDFKTLRTGQEVEFEMNDGPKGLHALSVVPLEEKSSIASEDEASTSGEATQEAEIEVDSSSTSAVSSSQPSSPTTSYSSGTEHSVGDTERHL